MTADELKRIAEAVADHLPDGWHPCTENQGVIRGPNHASLRLCQGGSARGTITGELPDDARPFMTWGQESPQIGINLRRKPAQVARAIETRLLPEYLSLYAKMREQVETTGLRESRLERIQGAVPKDPEMNARVTLCGSKIRVELSLTEDQALAIFDTLQSLG